MLLFLARTDHVCNYALPTSFGHSYALSPIQATDEASLLCILLLAVAQLGSASSCLPLVSFDVLATLCSCSTSHHRTGRLLP